MLNSETGVSSLYQLVRVEGVGDDEKVEVLDEDRDLNQLYQVRDRLQKEPILSMEKLRYAVRAGYVVPQTAGA